MLPPQVPGPLEPGVPSYDQQMDPCLWEQVLPRVHTRAGVEFGARQGSQGGQPMRRLETGRPVARRQGGKRLQTVEREPR